MAMTARLRAFCLALSAAASLAVSAREPIDSSGVGTLLEMTFDGLVTTDNSWNHEATVMDQLLYTVGSLNGSNAVGRLDEVLLTNVRAAVGLDGRYQISYHARMPVGWGSKTNLPATFTFMLPRDVSDSGVESFSRKYGTTCVDYGAHDVSPSSMWFYYRPRAKNCSLVPGDIVKFAASVTVSQANTTGKFPEYHKVWEDDELRVIAIFGKYEAGATTSADAGVSAYNTFVRASKTRLMGAGSQYETTPASVPAAPGTSTPSVEQRVRLPDGKRVTVSAFLIDSIAAAGQAFDSRYETLSGRADLIVYNGHSGFGTNTRALARKGSWIAAQYVVVFLNGADSFAYVDSALFTRHAEINTDDPAGTKYTEIIANAMPAFFANHSASTMTLINGFLSYATPHTYETILGQMAPEQVAIVMGEGDNTFVPPPPSDSALPMRVQSSVKKGEEKRTATGTLPAGNYLVTLTHDPDAPGGDADLYVRVGSEPTLSTYDCRPYKSGSNETCSITFAAPARIFTNVRGYADRSNAFILAIAAGSEQRSFER
jgi:hypothetical protein